MPALQSCSLWLLLPPFDTHSKSETIMDSPGRQRVDAWILPSLSPLILERCWMQHSAVRNFGKSEKCFENEELLGKCSITPIQLCTLYITLSVFIQHSKCLHITLFTNSCISSPLPYPFEWAHCFGIIKRSLDLLNLHSILVSSLIFYHGVAY